MFGFTVESIKSPEVLPKRAAAKLWKDIFEMAANPQGQYHDTAQEIVGHLGPAVTTALITNICGEVDATSLDNIGAPLRAMIKADKNSKSYINEALLQQPLLYRFKDDNEVQELVRKFVESLGRNMKHSNAFRDTVKSFWNSCKQLQMRLQPNALHRFPHGQPQPGTY